MLCVCGAGLIDAEHTRLIHKTELVSSKIFHLSNRRDVGALLVIILSLNKVRVDDLATALQPSFIHYIRC